MNLRCARAVILGLALLISSDHGCTLKSTAGSPGLPLLGKIKSRSASEIVSSPWSIGGETLDRDFAVYAHYRKFVGPLGAKGIRLQAGWAKCEKTPGVYDWGWLDVIINDALAQGIQPWLETSYGNTLYPGGGGTGLGGGLPKSPQALAAWDNWVQALLRRYKDRVHEWEIWNEPDLGRQNTPEDYTALFMRTARIIRKEQPTARIYALGLAGNLSFAEKFLQRVAQQDGLELINAITVHGYPRNPDDTANIDRLRAIISRFARPMEVRQGETGAPSKYQENFALSKIPWSENTQAKWDLRRMLAHHAKDIPFNLFTISDMHYRSGDKLQMNYKGLLGTQPDQTVSHAKLSYYAAQNVFAVFDDTLTRLTNFSWSANVTNAIAAFACSNKTSAGHVVAVWLKGAPPVESNSTTPLDLAFQGVKFAIPVYADLLTGKVYALPKEGDGSSFKQLPLYDSPILIAEKAALPLAGQ